MWGILITLWNISALLLAPGGGHIGPTAAAAPPAANARADAGEAAQAGSCDSDEDCDDGDTCTVDTCVDSACANEPECASDADCDDNNVCTIDECIEGCCEVRPQCFGSDDCAENFRCEYNCCIRCPTCHQIRRVWTRCRRGHLKIVMGLRNEECDGNTVTIDVGGEPAECEVRGRLARCDVRRVRRENTTVCVTGPDCPEHCYEVACGR